MPRVQVTVNLVNADDDSAGGAQSDLKLRKVLNNIDEL